MKINYEKTEYNCSDSCSFQDFTGHDLSKRTDLTNLVIYGACLSQEIPDRQIFPIAMRDVTFIKCNLDNCFIPPGNTVIQCSQNRFKAQPDGKDWDINILGQPTKVRS